MKNRSASELSQVSPSRLVVRSANWLGDAIMTIPALVRLREAFPQTTVALFTPDKLQELWMRHPAIDEVIAFSPDQGTFARAALLRNKQFQCALLFPNSIRSALELLLARVPKRIGYAGQWRSPLLTHPIAVPVDHIPMRRRSRRQIVRLISAGAGRESFPPSAHQLLQYLRLAEVLGAKPEPLAPFIEISAEECSQFACLHSLPVDRPMLGLNPGAEYGPAKRWPLERFVSAAAHLHSSTSAACVIFGGNNDLELSGALASKIKSTLGSPPARTALPIFNLAGSTGLRELAAGLKLMDLLLTNDTGPMHLAAAVGTPVLVPFGSTSPELTGPTLPTLSSPHAILKGTAPCAPCFRRTCPIDFRCMTSIKVEEVIAAALPFLARNNSGRGGEVVHSR
jgi:heptosyltransferase II